MALSTTEQVQEVPENVELGGIAPEAEGGATTDELPHRNISQRLSTEDLPPRRRGGRFDYLGTRGKESLAWQSSSWILKWGILLAVVATAAAQDDGEWVLLLKDAWYEGAKQNDAGFVPLANGRFSKFKFVYRSGGVTCSTGPMEDTWNTCGIGIELKKGRQYIVEEARHPKMPPMCKAPPTPTGDIICDVEFELQPQDTLIPTWYEPSHHTSTSDNRGRVYLDLYGYRKVVHTPTHAPTPSSIPLPPTTQDSDALAIFLPLASVALVLVAAPFAYRAYRRRILRTRHGYRPVKTYVYENGGSEPTIHWTALREDEPADEFESRILRETGTGPATLIEMTERQSGNHIRLTSNTPLEAVVDDIQSLQVHRRRGVGDSGASTGGNEKVSREQTV